MIRKATIKDKEEIYELGKMVNKNFEKVYNLDQMFEEKYNVIYVAEEDGKMVGLLIAIVLYETCEILNVVVLEEYRRKKIATNLIDTLISEFINTINTVTLEVAVDNENAIKLYKKFGLEIINTRKNYYDNTDAYLMGVKYEKC